MKSENVNPFAIYVILFIRGKVIYTGNYITAIHKVMLTDDEFILLQEFMDGRSKGKLQKACVCPECLLIALVK